ncbi:MAG TPA: hypothetical protein VFW87_14400 [Pirellulales bacterium]|nr:hypothetical protein [Pirellulales bacterium]
MIRKSLLTVAVVFPLIGALAWAQQAPGKTGDAAKPAAGAPAKARAKARGRLPAFYARVVSGDQREKIYAIQQSYEPKIADLQAQLKALTDKRDAEIEAVLTADQKTKVQQLATDAKAKRAARSGKGDAAAADATAAADGDSSQAPAADAAKSKAASTTKP